MKKLKLIILIACIITVQYLTGCYKKEETLSRYDFLPDDVKKVKPKDDFFPPVLHSDEYETPVPLEGEINTSGAEDSPFITPDGNNFYFFFTPDVRIPVEKQIIDKVSGIWWSKKIDGKWTEPERVILCDDAAMDGCTFIQGDTMWFASVRAGNFSEIDIYTAKLKDGKWTNVQNAGELLSSIYDIGEFHITSDGSSIYCGGNQKWEDFEGKDIFMLNKTKDGWSEPVPLPYPVNTQKYNEDQPFISADGNELWFTGQSRTGQPGPSIYRSIKNEEGIWGEPEEIISCFAGEPTLDDEENIFFIHHYFTQDMQMIEADIYVAYKKKSN